MRNVECGMQNETLLKSVDVGDAKVWLDHWNLSSEHADLRSGSLSYFERCRVLAKPK